MVLDFAREPGGHAPQPGGLVRLAQDPAWQRQEARQDRPQDRRAGRARPPQGARLRRCPPPSWRGSHETPGVAALALRLTILTCARTSETLNATFDEINFDTATWRVPKSG